VKKFSVGKLFFIICLLVFTGLSVLFNVLKKTKSVEQEFSLGLTEVGLIPVKQATASAKPLLLNADSWFVTDVASYSVLSSHNENEKLYPASTTKLVTALLASKIYNQEELVLVNKDFSSNGHNMGLTIGEKIMVKDLLAGLLIRSANDAAFVLANHHPQGIDGFVAAMNELARELALNNSNFTNPAGLDNKENYSTAKDLAILSREIIKDNYLFELVGTKNVEVFDESGEIRHNLLNTNAILGEVEGIKGIKTGTTNLAKEVLITLVDRDGKTIVIVLLGSNNRYLDTQKIIDWVYQNYQWVNSSYFLERKENL
jgi:serine-type D-Ala-D-Ala carboxypeptidase (penicillin-binding protein 5/6)